MSHSRSRCEGGVGNDTKWIWLLSGKQTLFQKNPSIDFCLCLMAWNVSTATWAARSAGKASGSLQKTRLIELPNNTVFFVVTFGSMFLLDHILTYPLEYLVCLIQLESLPLNVRFQVPALSWSVCSLSLYSQSITTLLTATSSLVGFSFPDVTSFKMILLFPFQES